MEPEIVTIPTTVLAGVKTEMSFSNNKTAELWAELMPKKHLLPTKNHQLFSVEVYPGVSFFERFDPLAKFTKWAAVEVETTENLPENIASLEIPAGLYAKFIYQGKASEAAAFYAKIFGDWLPNSDFGLANRPHFAMMGKKYKGEIEDSEEEIYIPIEKKS